MPTIIRLAEMPHETSFAPLGVLGYCLTLHPPKFCAKLG